MLRQGLAGRPINHLRHLPSRYRLLSPISAFSTARSYATVTDLANFPQPGASLHGFTLQRAQHVPELQLTALQLQHQKTGAEYLHIARDDKNNVFSIGFKTNPPDATGVPHILEHTTLCGSKTYPVRDPFFKMLPRSLSSFMNAFTASDHTFYPFATTNAKDFKNLLSVYMDATFHPLLKRDDFAQEGWRIGPENTSVEGSENAESDLVFKGVVYNEMKGQMSNAAYLYYTRYQDHIFPDINNSGGDPQKMTDLTNEDLKAFHAQNYHPSNAKIFTYGNMPLADHLAEVSRQLEQFEKKRAENAIKAPIQLSEPLKVVVQGPIDPLVDADMQHKTSTSWVLGDHSDVPETIGLRVMSSLLLNGYGSPLYRALIEKGLGPDFSPNTGFELYGKTGVFAVGLNGVKAEDVEKVKPAIQQTLREVHERGFEQHKIDGLLHQFELSLKHQAADFGVEIMQRLKPSWFNGIDPFEVLAWNKNVDEFKRRLSEGRYLERLLEKYLLNDQTFTFTMEPSAKYGEDLLAEEKERLASKIADISSRSGGMENARKQLTEQEHKLEAIQEAATHQPLDCLPMLQVSDIPRQMERKPLRDAKLGDVAVQWREAPTNGLTYFRAICTFDNLPSELRSLVPLFSDAIMRLGTKDKTMEELEDLIKANTGGISTSYFSKPRYDDLSQTSEGLAVAGYALDRNVPAMYDLLRTLVQETNFDGPQAESMIRQLLQAYANSALDTVANVGHSYARRYAESQLFPHAALLEQTAGLTQVQLLSELARRPAEQGLGDVIAMLKVLQASALASTGNLRVALTCGSDSVAANEAALQGFLSKLPQVSNPFKLPSSSLAGTNSTAPPARTSKTFFPLPYQVYYTATSHPTVPYTSSEGPALQILAQLLTHNHLHHEIREKGGAYGGGAYSLALGGTFGFTSYRDPNPQRTLRTMRSAGQWAADRAWTAQELNEAKLATFQGIDAPESVNEEGMTRFLSGIDEGMEQTRRERLLDVQQADVHAVAAKYLVNATDARSVVLGETKPWVDGSEWDVRKLTVGA